MNNTPMTITDGEYAGYSLNFDLDIVAGGSTHDIRVKAVNENYEGHSTGNTMERGNSESNPVFFKEKEVNGQSGPVGGRANKNTIIMNTSTENNKDRIHEIFHTLGLIDFTGGIMNYPPGRVNQQNINDIGNSSFLPAIPRKSGIDKENEEENKSQLL